MTATDNRPPDPLFRVVDWRSWSKDPDFVAGMAEAEQQRVKARAALDLLWQRLCQCGGIDDWAVLRESYETAKKALEGRE